MADVTIYGVAPSTYVRSARMICEEKGVSHELEGIEFGSPGHLAIHPFSKMPGFRHGDVVLYETTAIGVYVDEAFDGPALQPADAAARARMLQWMSATVDYGYQGLVRELIVPRIVIPARGGETDMEMIAGAKERNEHFLGLADDATGGGYLVGDALSLADLLLIPIVSYISVTPEGKEMLANTKNLAAWLARMSERLSFTATIPPPPTDRKAAK